MKKIFLSLSLFTSILACAQDIDVAEVRRIETALSSDEMRGRRAGTPDIDRAADFIAKEFKRIGLQPVEGNSYLQRFTMLRPRFRSIKAEIGDQEIDTRNVIVITTEKEVKVNEKSGYGIVQIPAGANLFARARALVDSGKNLVVYVDNSYGQNFGRLTGFKRGDVFPMQHSVFFVLGTPPAGEFTFKAEHTIEEIPYANVVGMLPGKSKKNESVIFSAHYDHLGVAREAKGADSIYNGANDDAAGTTAVIMLAEHFKKAASNERTLIFAAFTAEEVGGFGSRYFSKKFDPATVAAMFNIEMIGTESKWGRNSAFITGYDKSDMGAIMQRNLEGTDFKFHPDPYIKENLFYRSDNATLARLGVPAHTISTAKMEEEPNYHQLSDEVGTLDLQNMAAIIRAIALSSRSIVSGKDTPSRVKPETLSR